MSSNISRRFGTTTVIITPITQTTTSIIIAGYIRADLSFQVIDATFSTWSASEVITTSSCPVFSPERIIPISAASKDLWCLSRHSERFFHSFSHSTHSSSIFLSAGFFSCFSKTLRDLISGIPALSITASNRYSMTLSFVFTFPNHATNSFSFVIKS